MLSLSRGEQKAKAAEDALRSAIATLIKTVAEQASLIAKLQRQVACLERDFNVLLREQFTQPPSREK